MLPQIHPRIQRGNLLAVTVEHQCRAQEKIADAALPMPSRGSALVVLGAFEMAVLPRCAVLTGSLWGPFIAGLFASANLPISWLEYARVLTIPTIIWCGLIVAVNLFVTRPEPAPGMSPDIVRTEIEKLGPIKGGRAHDSRHHRPWL